MDILDFLLSPGASSQYIRWLLVIGLIVLFVIGRGVVGMIYYALFPSKRPGRTKSFEQEIEENRNQPMSGSESIGSLSMRLGEGVRDVWAQGYSNDQINGVLTGKYTLEEMYKMAPAGNTVSSEGKKILDRKHS